MNRATRDKLVSGTEQADLTTGNACWETPPLVFEKLDTDFGPFDVDLTADARRHLCRIWFGPQSCVGEWDALTANWISYGDNGYSNPPYGPFIQRLLVRAKAFAAEGFTSTLLLPLRITKAFRTHILPFKGAIGASDLLLCDKRLTFFENGVPRLNEAKYGKRGKKGQLLKVPTDPAVFDSIIVRYVPGATRLNVDTWHVPKHVTPDDLARAVELRQGRKDESVAMSSVFDL